MILDFEFSWHATPRTPRQWPWRRRHRTPIRLTRHQHFYLSMLADAHTTTATGTATTADIAADWHRIGTLFHTETRDLHTIHTEVTDTFTHFARTGLAQPHTTPEHTLWTITTRGRTLLEQTRR